MGILKKWYASNVEAETAVGLVAGYYFLILIQLAYRLNHIYAEYGIPTISVALALLLIFIIIAIFDRDLKKIYANRPAIENLPFRLKKERQIREEEIINNTKERLLLRPFLLVSFFILSWFLLFILFQLEKIDAEFQTDKHAWWFTVFYSSFTSLFIVILLHGLRLIFASFDVWHCELEKQFANLRKYAFKKYLNPRRIIQFFFVTVLIVLAFLILGYWVDNTGVPEIKKPRCPAGIECDVNQLVPNNFSTTPAEALPNGNSNSPFYIDSPQRRLESETNILRNKWLWIVAFIGVGLTVWGRFVAHKQAKQRQEQIRQTDESIKISKDAIINERLMKAVEMLGNESLVIRVNACSSLRWLAVDHEEMKKQCVHLLFTFINHPYEDEKNKLETSTDLELRGDIQEAVKSFSDIYRKYGGKKINIYPIKFPLYFWQHRTKGSLCLAETDLSGLRILLISLPNADFRKVDLDNSILQHANFQNADLRNATLNNSDFSNANFQSANLEAVSLDSANLSHANLSSAKFKDAWMEDINLSSAKLEMTNLEGAWLASANFQNANLTGAQLHNSYLGDTDFTNAKLKGANMQGADVGSANFAKAKNLTKEQILSAKWTSANEFDVPPSLPPELAEEPEVQEWLGNPTFID